MGNCSGRTPAANPASCSALISLELWLLILLTTFPGSVGAVESVVSPIAPGLAIVTEFSSATPFVGQQLAVIYRLRADQAPAAVDVDPQQFSGFWSEIVPISDHTRSGLPPHASPEFLLRQVVVYPFFAGDIRLPPLRLKVKWPAQPPQSEDWDVIGISSPIVLHVRDVPPTGRAPRWPLVGAVAGSFHEGRHAGYAETILELKGTAHLDLFDLAEWLRFLGHNELLVRSLDSENSVQTVDMRGKRQISLIQRRRWAIRATGGSRAVESLTIPIFQPDTQSYTDLRLRANR